MSTPLTASWIAATLVALAPLAAQAQGQQPAMPEGEAKVLVENLCITCHRTNLITNSMGYTRDGWKELIGTMIDLSANEDMRDKLTGYLATNFPPNTRRAPTLVSGPIQITWKEWVNPQLGQRSRDPMQAADGKIWWAGQFGNLIGSLDPATGEMKEYQLPHNALPHTVELDAKGNAWFTGNKNGTVGYVDPKSGQIKVFKMPDPNAKDPHTLVFDKKGTAWFTLQNSNMVGRLDPESGDIKLVKLSTPGSKPYGIKIDAEGNPWFSCNGRPCLYKIDPATHGVDRGEAAARRHHGAPSRHRRRRDDLVRQLRVWAGSGATIRRPARSRNGRRRAGRNRIRTRSSSLTASSGTTSRACGPIRWCASIPRPRRSRAGPSRPATSMRASSGTCARRATAAC